MTAGYEDRRHFRYPHARRRQGAAAAGCPTAFAGVDLILHAGDIYGASCLDWLERIAPIVAVEQGGSSYFDNDPRVEVRRVFELEGHTIGMVHELVLPNLVGEPFPGATAEGFPEDASCRESAAEIFGQAVDIVIFGHTHVSLVEGQHGVLFLNPGSPALRRHIRRLGPVAILELVPGVRRVDLVELATVV